MKPHLSHSYTHYVNKNSQTFSSQGIFRREDVIVTMIQLDPEDISMRIRTRLHRPKYIFKGPSYTWHNNDYDKLKLFGFSVHGCIDAFSWKSICLKAGLSSKNPDFRAHYYVDGIAKLWGVPYTIKANDGTGFALIESTHIYLRFFKEEEEIENAFSFKTSP